MIWFLHYVFFLYFSYENILSFTHIHSYTKTCFRCCLLYHNIYIFWYKENKMAVFIQCNHVLDVEADEKLHFEFMWVMRGRRCISYTYMALMTLQPIKCKLLNCFPTSFQPTRDVVHPLRSLPASWSTHICLFEYSPNRQACICFVTMFWIPTTCLTSTHLLYRPYKSTHMSSTFMIVPLNFFWVRALHHKYLLTKRALTLAPMLTGLHKFAPPDIIKLYCRRSYPGWPFIYCLHQRFELCYSHSSAFSSLSMYSFMLKFIFSFFTLLRSLVFLWWR